MKRETLHWHDLPGVVNLRDFADMVVTELRSLGTSLRQAPRSLPRPPFGPLLLLAGTLVTMLRLALLVLVVVVFGSAILAITVSRGVAALARRRRVAGQQASDDS